MGSTTLSDLGKRTVGNAIEFAGMLGIPADSYADDPLALLAALQNYVSRLPLDEFQQSDWMSLHIDLTRCRPPMRERG